MINKEVADNMLKLNKVLNKEHYAEKKAKETENLIKKMNDELMDVMDIVIGDFNKLIS